MLINNVTIYTDINQIKYMGNIMKKVCRICSIPKELEFYYKRHLDCIDCWNRQRREINKKSFCSYCKSGYRPGIQGRHKYCSEWCRFVDKIKIDELSGCWNWQGAIQKKKGGYGTFQVEEKVNALAHRVSYRLFKGKLKDNLFVLHSCHNTHCVAPNHLRQGTPMDNTLDRKKAGRTTNPGKK